MSYPLERPVAVTIDLHRGHLDPVVATMPLPAEAAERVTAANVDFLAICRENGLPVVHVVTTYRSQEEIARNPWWSAVSGTDVSRANVLSHQLPGSPGHDLMPGVWKEGDVVVTSKKRYDSFQASDLEFALRALGAKTLFLTGVNTSSCVIATTVAANARDFAPVVVEECVDTMDRALHEPALAVIRGAFGWVTTTDEIRKRLGAES